MGKVTVAQTNFTAGELSPRLRGRVDIAKYGNGAKTILNGLPTVQGGVRKRGGLTPLLDSPTGYATSNAPLRAFVFDSANVYLVALASTASAPVYIFDITNTGYATVNNIGSAATTPASFADRLKMRYTQGADTMFLTHYSQAPMRIVRTAVSGAAPAQFTFEPVAFDSSPAENVGERQNTTCTASATTGVVTLTAGANAFRLADVGRFYEDSKGRALITAFTSATQVTATVQQALNAGAQAANTWRLTGTPTPTTVTPASVGTLGQSINFTASSNTWKDGTFATSHVGAFIEINGGLALITSVTSATVAVGTIYQPLTSAAAAPSKAWRLLFNPFNAIDGYPRACALWSQRLMFGGTAAKPTGVWASNVADYYNFAPGTLDAAGFQFDIAIDLYDPIEHLSPLSDLVVYTASGQSLVRGGVEKPITPTSITVKPQSSIGCDGPRPTRAGNDLAFIQRHGRKLRAASYDSVREQIISPDISLLAEHLTESGIVDMAYQQSPEAVLWLVRADGSLISVTYDRDQDVIGWAKHTTTDGLIKTVAVCPVNGEDRVYVGVSRQSGAGWSVEYIDDTSDLDYWHQATNERTGTTTFAASTVTVTDIGSHGYSNGDTIYTYNFVGGTAIPDGNKTITVTGASTFTFASATGSVGTIAYSKANAGPFSVDNQTGMTWKYRIYPGGPWLYGGVFDITGGSVTFPIAASFYQWGYLIDCQVVTLPTELSGGEGTAQGNASSVHEIIARVLTSTGATIQAGGNAQQLVTAAYAQGATIDADQRTTDVRAEALGWGNTGAGDWNGEITVRHNTVGKFFLLSLIKKLTVNAG